MNKYTLMCLVFITCIFYAKLPKFIEGKLQLADAQHVSNLRQEGEMKLVFIKVTSS